MKNFIDPALLAASTANQVKYLPANIVFSVPATNKNGDLDNAELNDASEGMPYPLVGGDIYGKDLLVPIWLKSENDTMYFPEVVVSITKNRNIVATPVLNGKGTVKEMITDGDLEVSLSLAIVSTTTDGDYDGEATQCYDVYPYVGMERLRKMLDEPCRLEITSDFLRLFDLDGGELGIVVKSFTVAQTTHLNRQVVEIQAVSDYDYNLLIES